MAETAHAVMAAGLRKSFGGQPALAGFDLEVAAGTVCAVLGPNGAGKTTAVRILSTLLLPDGGRAEVAGLDVVRQARQVRHRIGLVGQHAAVDEALSGRQNLVMFGRLFHLPPAAARRRADELLAQFALDDTGGKPAGQFSGGMRRRLDLAASLVLAPPVLFLDEPTTGLDPRGRGEVWAAVRGLVAGGTTVLLTTQYLDEADQLADQVCLVDRGQVVERGSPDQLKAALGGDRIDVVVRRPDALDAAVVALGTVASVSVSVSATATASAMALASGDARAGVPTGSRVTVDADQRRVSVPVASHGASVAAAVRALDTAGIEVDDLTLRRPTLDEVFLRLTGRPASPASDDDLASDDRKEMTV